MDSSPQESKQALVPDTGNGAVERAILWGWSKRGLGCILTGSLEGRAGLVPCRFSASFPQVRQEQDL